MRKLTLALAAAMTIGMAASAAATDDITFGARGWWGGHGAYAYDRGWWGGPGIVGDDCAAVRVRERLPDGSVIIHTRRSC